MDVMQSFAAGAQAVTDAEQSSQDYQSLIGSKQDLKSAYQESTIDPETGKSTVADSFKVNRLAATKAASRGDLKSFELFNKQAQSYKHNELANQIQELNIKNDGIEKAERVIQMMDTPDDAMKEVMSEKSPLPMPERLQIVKQLSALKDNPEGFKEWKKQHRNALLSAKDAVMADIRTMEVENTKLWHEEDLKIKRLKANNEAKHQSNMEGRDISKTNKADAKEAKKEEQAIITHDEKVNDDIYSAEKDYINEIAKADKIKDEEQQVKAKDKIKADYKARIKTLQNRKHVSTRAKETFGSYDPNKYEYRVDPKTNNLQRKEKG